MVHEGLPRCRPHIQPTNDLAVSPARASKCTVMLDAGPVPGGFLTGMPSFAAVRTRASTQVWPWESARCSLSRRFTANHGIAHDLMLWLRPPNAALH